MSQLLLSYASLGPSHKNVETKHPCMKKFAIIYRDNPNITNIITYLWSQNDPIFVISILVIVELRIMMIVQ